MQRRLAKTLLGAASTALAGCASISFYTDAERHQAYYAELRRGAAPTTVRLESVFLRADQRAPDADAGLRHEVLRVLRETGVYSVTDDASAPVLKVIVDDDPAGGKKSRRRFFFTGAMFRSATVPTDLYQVTINYRDTDGRERYGHYERGLWTAVGKPEVAADRGRYDSPDAAFGAVIEDTLLSFLRGLKAYARHPAPSLYLPDEHQPEPAAK
jgi:hypothetical protein